jgi:hypothetical protein
MLTQIDTDTFCLNEEQYAAYSCICYFDIFDHPIKLAEVVEFNGKLTTASKIKDILDELLHRDLIGHHEGFYFLYQQTEGLIKKRNLAEQRFHKKINTIKWFGRFISKFPFVASVAVSGSCSKELLEDDGDVDYFIITSAKRVWLCRTLLIAFKKIFLFNSKKYFCVNYFIGEDHLEIPDKNTFVATEIATLLPLSNKVLFEKFLNANAWTKEFLPNKMQYKTFFLKDKKRRAFLPWFFEILLRNPFGDWLDKFCFRLTLNNWQKKFPDFDQDDFDLNLRSKKAVSKHHPRGFQQKVLLELDKKLTKVKQMA